jgi:hypothetical protein
VILLYDTSTCEAAGLLAEQEPHERDGRDRDQQDPPEITKGLVVSITDVGQAPGEPNRNGNRDAVTQQKVQRGRDQRERRRHQPDRLGHSHVAIMARGRMWHRVWFMTGGRRFRLTKIRPCSSTARRFPQERCRAGIYFF